MQYKEKVMDIAELRTKLDSIAAELAEQDVQQEEIAIEEHHEKDEDGNVIPHDDISEEEVEESDYKLDPETDKYTLVSKPEQPTDMRSRARHEKGIDLKDKKAKDDIKTALSSLIPDEVKRDAKAAFGFGEAVEEATVEIPVQELADIMQLAGYANYAERIEEFANTPDGAQGEPAYMDAEDQLIGLSGGLNGPKTMHPPAADGDNPMDTEPREVEETMEAVEDKLYKSYQAFLEAEITEQD